PEERARHRALGANGPDEVIAKDVEEASVSAAARGACDTAAALAEMAVNLTPTDRTEERHRRMALEAENRFEASEPDRAVALLEEVVEAVESGPIRAEILRRLARYQAYRGDHLTTWITRLVAALDQSGEDLTLRCTIALDLCAAAANAGDQNTATAYGQLALDLALQTGDTARQGQAAGGMAYLAFCNGEGVQRDLVEQALAGSEQPNRLSMELRPRYTIGVLLHYAGDLDAARVLLEREYQQAVAQGMDIGLPQLLWGLAETEAWAGNWDRAEELAAQGSLLAEDSGLSVMIGLIAGVSGLMHIYRGRIQEGLRAGDKAVAVGMSMQSPPIALAGAQVLGLAELSLGDPAAALERLGPMADMVRAMGVAEPGQMRFLPDEIEALIRLGDLDAAVELLDPFEAKSIELSRVWGVATSSRCQGLLLAARGDIGGGETALDIALEHHSELAMPFEHGRTLLVAGEIHRRARHRSLANIRLQSAVGIFEELGAPLWEARAREEIGRLGLRRATPGPGLTAIEIRVADLATTGLTNAQIATRLFMSPRTVEAHLSRIYRKLGVHSRTAMSRAYLHQSTERS
ncbi:MAG: LuxR C-terminal-related transcriptional regulator, partial [Acidimicrobiales bacterium]